MLLLLSFRDLKQRLKKDWVYNAKVTIFSAVAEYNKVDHKQNFININVLCTVTN